MNETSNWLVHDHRKYDAILDECEMVAGAGEWKDAKQLFYRFVDDFKLHMRMEDEVLYPFFKEEFGDPDDVIADLGDEHDDIVRLLRDLASVIKRNDIDHFEESLVPLHKAILQHNEHEESVFQSIASNSLLTRRDEILERLNSMHLKEGRRNWDF
jgi:hemerythrin superfamily protein